MKEYTRGSILALQELTDSSKIIWGQNYVIETEEMRVTKKIAKGENEFHLTGYSTNTETYSDGTMIHQPIKFTIEGHFKIYKVLGSFTRETNTTVI